MANYDVKGYIKDSNNYYFKDATARSSITAVDNKIGNLSTTQVTGSTVAAQITALNGKITAVDGKIPTVNNGTLTIQRNGTNVATFTANQSGNATANITVPTALSALTADATHRLVTDTQISTWNNKADKSSISKEKYQNVVVLRKYESPNHNYVILSCITPWADRITSKEKLRDYLNDIACESSVHVYPATGSFGGKNVIGIYADNEDGDNEIYALKSDGVVSYVEYLDFWSSCSLW